MQPNDMQSIPELLTYKPEEVGHMLGIARNSVYEAIARGEIPSLRFGRRIVIPRAAFDRMLNEAKV